MIRVLNLYSGIGGNRKLWQDVEVTAVEKNEAIANIYKDFFPNDNVIVGDAHQYLLDHHKEFDFIWSSPPCPTHSRTNYFLKAKIDMKYPDMSLYQEVIFLSNFFKGLFCVENVISYYDPLIPPRRIGRHYFWTNFPIGWIETPKDDIGKMCGKNQKASKIRRSIIREAQVPELEQLHKFDLSKITVKNKRQVLRNCVLPEVGLHIFNAAFQKEKIVQENIFKVA